MTTLRFRNIDCDPSDPMDTWPHEAFQTVIERGLVPDWQRVADEIDRNPFGAAAATLAEVLEYVDESVAQFILLDRLERARAAAVDRELARTTEGLRQAVRDSGLSARELARRVGSSESRMSTWLSGRQAPSANTLARITLALGRPADQIEPASPSRTRSARTPERV